MGFELKITETRTYLNGTTEDDSPFVCQEERSVCTASTFPEMEKEIKNFVKSFKSPASIGEVSEDGGGNYEIRIDISDVCISCEVTKDTAWTKAERKSMDKLEGLK